MGGVHHAAGARPPSHVLWPAARPSWLQPSPPWLAACEFGQGRLQETQGTPSLQFKPGYSMFTATLAVVATIWLPELTLHAPFRPFLPPSVLPCVPSQRPLQHAPPLLPAACARPLSETLQALARAAAAAAAVAAPVLLADWHNDMITSVMSLCRMHLIFRWHIGTHAAGLQQRDHPHAMST